MELNVINRIKKQLKLIDYNDEINLIEYDKNKLNSNTNFKLIANSSTSRLLASAKTRPQTNFTTIQKISNGNNDKKQLVNKKDLIFDSSNFKTIKKDMNSSKRNIIHNNMTNVDIQKRILKGKLMNLINKNLIIPIPDIIPDVSKILKF